MARKTAVTKKTSRSKSKKKGKVGRVKDAEATLDKEKPQTLTDEQTRDVVFVAQKTEEAKDYVKRMRVLRNNIPKLYGLVWGQCTPGLQSELQGESEYKDKSNEFNCLWLMWRN